MRIQLLAATALLASAGTAHGAAFTNGSFESAVGAPALGGFTEYFAGDTSMTGWTVTTGSVDLVGTTYYAPDFVASNGNYSVDLNGDARGGIAQTFDTVAGQTYQVSFDLNINPYDGSTLDRAMQVTAGGYSGTFTYPTALHPVGAGGPWQHHSFTFTATGASTTLAFTSLYTNSCCTGPELDNVQVALAAVPEPASWAMMIAGLGVAGGAMRRRRAPVAGLRAA